MAIVTLMDGEIALHEVVGTPTLMQGRALVRAGAVDSVRADLDEGALVGTVRDGRTSHQVRVSAGGWPDGPLGEIEAECGCGRVAPCPHAVALLLLAAGASPAETSVIEGRLPLRMPAGPRSPSRPRAVPPPAIAAPPPWARLLRAALDDPPAAGRSGRQAPAQAHPSQGAPALALQFELTGDPHGRIAVRPVVPGRNGGWVRSGVSWSTLLYPGYHLRSVPAAHLRLLLELQALPSTSAYTTYTDRVLLLDTIVSRRVWDVLWEAQEVGLPLVTGGRRPAPVVVHREPAVATLDVRRSDTDLMVTPELAVADRPVVGYVGIGDPPHGVAWRLGAPDDGLALARLDPRPPPLFARLAGGEPLHVPVEDEARFLDEFYPQLLQHVRVVSRDRSVELPAPAPPVLTLCVTGRGGHRLDLAWTWVHAVGSARRSEPLAEPFGPGAQDAAATRLLAEVAALLGDIPGLVEAPTSEAARPAAAAQLDGVDTARFMTQVMPLLRTRPDVDVQIVEAGPQYREVDAVPVISFTADGAPEVGPGSQDWFDLAVTVTVEGHQVPFEALFVALAHGESRLLLDNGMYFSLDHPEFAQLAQLIAESRDLLDAPPATVRLGRFHASLWDEVEQLGEITGQAETWRESIRTLSASTALPGHKVPAGLQATLRPYQQVGFDWLATLFDLRLGGILADDMGLGKTVQALALMLHAREQGLTDRPFLVVAPTSVVANWASEAGRFAPGLAVATITQTAARRGHDLAQAVAGADLVVTSYTLFRLEHAEYKAVSWAGLVLDEAQNVKNHQSSGYRCARQLPAEFKLAITGTPMENNLMELWSLLSITAPGLFPRTDRFTEYFRTPIERERDPERLDQLRRRVRPLMLRRTKDQVAGDLPDRQEQVMELELNSRHRAVYAKYLQRERQKVLGLLGDFNRNRFEIFRSLTLLRQLSLDASLVDQEHAGVPSTKLDALMDHLKDIVAEGHRVLVFSQFTRFLTLARERLVEAGIDHCYLDGSTTNRARVISRFRSGTAPVFLISLKAGGTGLNLTEADYVVLLDPWWNPATEAQAVDRAHRIGQTRKVMVYRMVAKDTIEEKVMALKERKAALTASVLDNGDFASGGLTADDIRGLLG